MSFGNLRKSPPVVAGALAVALSFSAASATVVYDNTTNPTGEDLSTYGGSEIALAPGPRYVTGVAVAVRLESDAPGAIEARVEFYANDDGEYTWGRAPGTLIWRSDWREETLPPGETAFLEFPAPAVLVPDRFTWFVDVIHLGGDIAKVRMPLYYPPSVGSARAGFWGQTPGPPGWGFLETEAVYGVRITARGIPAVSTWGFAVLAIMVLAGGTLVIRGRLRKTVAGVAMVVFAALPGSAEGPVEIGDPIPLDSGGIAAANETSISATGSAPFEIVAAWNDWRESPPNPEVGESLVRLGAAVSNNGGANWTDLLVRPPASVQEVLEADPMTAYDPRTGTLWLGGIANDAPGTVLGALWVTSKISGQDAFQDPAAVPDSGVVADKPLMAAGPVPGSPGSTNLYIAYSRGLVPFVEPLLPYLVVSSDMGVEWSAPIELPLAQEGTGPQGLVPRVGPNGEVYVLAWDSIKRIHLTRSFDGGQTWEGDGEPPEEDAILVAERMDYWDVNDGAGGGVFAGDFRVPPWAYLAVDTTTGMPDSGALYCVFFDTTLPEVLGQYNVDLYFTKSTDEGLTWSIPKVINGDIVYPGPEGEYEVGDQFFPWIEVDSVGNLHVVFFDTRDPPQKDGDESAEISVYYLLSSDGGETWDEFELTPGPFNSADDGLNLTEEPRTQFVGDYLALATAGTTAYACYPYATGTDTDIYVQVIEVLDGACCLPDDTCAVLVPRLCSLQGGVLGDYETTCEAPVDCNLNGVADQCDLIRGTSLDCNGNGVPDTCDLAQGTSLDCDGTGVPDECENCAAGCWCGGGCYECCDDSHCTDPSEPRCGIDLLANQCVECVEDDDCTGSKPYCLELQGICHYCQTPQCPMGPGSE